MRKHKTIYWRYANETGIKGLNILDSGVRRNDGCYELIVRNHRAIYSRHAGENRHPVKYVFWIPAHAVATKAARHF